MIALALQRVQDVSPAKTGKRYGDANHYRLLHCRNMESAWVYLQHLSGWARKSHGNMVKILWLRIVNPTKVFSVSPNHSSSCSGGFTTTPLSIAALKTTFNPGSRSSS